MKILVGIFFLTLMALLDFRCAEGSGVETPRARGRLSASSVPSLPSLPPRPPRIPRPPVQPVNNQLDERKKSPQRVGGHQSNQAASPAAPSTAPPAAPPAAVRILFKAGSPVTLLLSDGTDRVGALKPHGDSPPPNWIFIQEYGKFIVYVLTPRGAAWITELKENNPHGRITTMKPQAISIDLPHNIRLVAAVKVFNRAERLIRLSQNNNKFQVFLTMPDGIAYTGYLKLSSNRF